MTHSNTVSPSHCDRVLNALRDGQWRTSAWLYRNGCEHMILHSRISDLRAKGHNVEGRHVPGKTGADGYQYRLLPSVTYLDVPKVRRGASSLPRAAAPPAEQLAHHVAPAHYDS